MSLRYDVFLSHSTADKPAVEELARKLRAAGIEPFLDKWHLVPGEPWQEALEQALDESRSCAVFVGPKKIGPWQNEEMRSALEDRVQTQAFRVIPVLLRGALESHKEKLPRFLRRLVWVDFRAGLDDEGAFHRLVSGIRGIPPDTGVGGGVAIRSYRSMAQPPEAFIHRQEYDEVLEALCSAAGVVQSASVGITTALRGAGGFGKTDLAQAICQDLRVRQTYLDGILWATMGEAIDAHGRLAQVRDLIRWWTREEAPAFETVAAAGARLRELLAGSRVLVVIDDVWSSADVMPFQGLGTGSALLITTRDSQALPIDSKRIEVDAMEPSEAVSLLRLGLPEGSSKEFESLAARLGAWALLLKLVNRQLQELVKEDGLPVPKALRRVEEDLQSEGFSAFDLNDPRDRNAAVSRTILVSVRRLPEGGPEFYLQLAVFPEGVHIPLPILERFWGIGRSQTRRLCRRLNNLSLLRKFDLERETIRLHDVIRKVLIEQIGKELPALHSHLLDVFRPSSGLWPNLAVEESYLWRHLSYHFLGAERRGELRDLLRAFSFLEAKLRATDVNSLISEYEAFSEEIELRMIRDALRLSSHILSHDGWQLAPQLLGRLKKLRGQGLQRLIGDARSWRGRVWLRPRTASLTQPGGSLIRVLEGHTAGVSAVTAVDRRRAVSASDDGALRVWDLETGQTLRTLEGHTAGVRAVAAVDGRRAVSASDDQTLRVWDLETGQTLRILEGHTAGVSAVAVVDGRRAVSGSADGTLRMWDLETGQTLRTLEGHTAGVSAVAVVESRRAISSSFYSETLRVWDLETGQTLRTIEADAWGVVVVGGRRIVSTIRRLRVWDLETGETLRTLEGNEDWDSTLVRVVDGHRVVPTSDAWTLRVWDLETGETLRTLEGQTAEIDAVAVVDDHCIVFASEGTFRVWDLETGQILRVFGALLDWVTALAVVDNRRVVSASNDGTLRLWDLETDETPLSPEGHRDPVNSLIVVDNRFAVSASEEEWTARVWDLETGQTLRILHGHWAWITALAVVDSRRVISASADGTLRLWDLDTGEILRTLEGHSAGVNAVALVKNRCVVSASSDKTLRLWDLETGETLRTLEGHLAGVDRVVPVDDHRVISASGDRTLRLWDLENGATLRKGQSRWTGTLVVVDSLRVVSVSSKSLRLWDLETAKTLRIVETSAAVRAVAVVDVRRAVLGSDDGTLRLWDLDTGEMMELMTLEAPVSVLATSPNGRIVVAGDEGGRVHFFDLVEPEKKQPDLL